MVTNNTISKGITGTLTLILCIFMILKMPWVQVLKFTVLKNQHMAISMNNLTKTFVKKTFSA